MTEWTTPKLTEVSSLRPADLARRWQCSERTVRSLVRNGVLPAFRIGGKLLRIPLDAVEAYERCNRNSGPFFIVDGTTPNGAKTVSSVAKRFVPSIVSAPSKR